MLQKLKLGLRLKPTKVYRRVIGSMGNSESNDINNSEKKAQVDDGTLPNILPNDKKSCKIIVLGNKIDEVYTELVIFVYNPSIFLIPFQIIFRDGYHDKPP